MNAYFSYTACVRNRCDLDTFDWHLFCIYVLLGNFDASLLSLLKSHVDSDGMINTSEMPR